MSHTQTRFVRRCFFSVVFYVVVFATSLFTFMFLILCIFSVHVQCIFDQMGSLVNFKVSPHEMWSNTHWKSLQNQFHRKCRNVQSIDMYVYIRPVALVGFVYRQSQSSQSNWLFKKLSLVLVSFLGIELLLV